MPREDISGNIVQNTVASTGKDEDWLIGFELNKAKSPGSRDFRYNFRYNYRDLEADAPLMLNE